MRPTFVLLLLFAASVAVFAAKPNFPYFSQNDSRWSNERCVQTNSTIGEKGSIVTCIAMLVAGYGNEMSNPITINKYFKKYEEVAHAEDANVMKRLGFQVTGAFDTFDEIAASISEENYCILYVDDIHTVLVTGINEDTFVVMDPKDQARTIYHPEEVSIGVCFKYLN